MSTRNLKQLHNHSHVLIMPLFSLIELKGLRSAIQVYATKLTESEVEVIFKLAGGSARMVLEWPAFKQCTPEKMASHLESRVKGLNDAQLQVTHVMHPP